MWMLCIGIFVIRIVDVSLATLMTIYVIKGKRKIASIIGFIDVLLWFLIAREALSGENNNIFIALSYAGGYAVGTFVGSIIAERYMTGNVGIQVFTSTNDKQLIKEIRKNGYAVSAIECEGIKENERKYMLYINIERKKERELRELINKIDNNAFIVVSETMQVQNGYFKN